MYQGHYIAYVRTDMGESASWAHESVLRHIMAKSPLDPSVPAPAPASGLDSGNKQIVTEKSDGFGKSEGSAKRPRKNSEQQSPRKASFDRTTSDQTSPKSVWMRFKYTLLLFMLTEMTFLLM
jgi:hypothetical protein